MITLFRLKYSKRDLEHVPTEEKIVYFMLGEAANCISTLSKQTLFWLQPKDSELDVETYARTSAAVVNLKLLAGTIYETWKIIQSEQHSKLYAVYKDVLDDDARQALAEIKKYFNYSNNLIKGLRLKIAFHNDYPTAAGAFATLPEDVDLADFVGEYFGNMFYNGSHVMTAYSMLHLLGESDPERGLVVTSQEVMGISNLIERYVHGYCSTFVKLHLERLNEFSGIPSVEIRDAPGINEVCLPYFVRR